MPDPEKLIPPHGGYGKSKSFQVAQLAYDVTVRFCNPYIEKRSRTLATFRDALLPKLLSDKLRVPTATDLLEGTG